MEAKTRIDHHYILASIVAATIVAAVSLLLILSQGVSAQPEDSRTPPGQGTVTGEPTESPGYSGLLHEAEREGSVSVIVGLRTGFEPEGRLTRSQVVHQREGIARLRAELGSDLEGTGYRTVRRFETIPYVALKVSPRRSGHSRTLRG